MSRNSRKHAGEFALIADLFAPLAKAKGAFGLTDDVARIDVPKGCELVVTTDAIVEGVDFFANDPPASIAKKALRVNLSDLAAKGAAPFGYLLVLALPKHIDRAWLTRFARGLADDQRAFGLSLLGGDMTSTPGPLSITVTAFGSVKKGRLIRRAGARPGDLVFVSGTIGDSGAGLELLGLRAFRAYSSKLARTRSVGTAGPRALVARYRIPEPRVALGARLAGVAHAALDVSDGLIADLGHIATTSRVRIVVDAPRVPLSVALKSRWGGGDDAILRAVTAGDDYEIAFAAPASARRKIATAARAARVAVTEIGRVERGRGIVLLDTEGRALPTGKGGYTHL